MKRTVLARSVVMLTALFVITTVAHADPWTSPTCPPATGASLAMGTI